MGHRQRLGNPTAERVPGHDGPLETQRIEDAENVGRHVGDPVGGRR